MRQINQRTEIVNKPDSVCLRCDAYYKNAGIKINDIDDPVERLNAFGGRYCRGRTDLSGCDLGPYKY
jgi:hypothetical protein